VLRSILRLKRELTQGWGKLCNECSKWFLTLREHNLQALGNNIRKIFGSEPMRDEEQFRILNNL
jgi:hypothetical protein